MIKKLSVLLVVGWVGTVSNLSFGAVGDVETSVSQNEGAKTLGEFETRPTWKTRTGGIGTENKIMGGYQFTPKFSIRYEQEFRTNIDGSAHSLAADDSVDFHFTDGTLRADFMDVWVSSDQRTSLTLSPRMVVPTAKAKREAGMIAIAKNHIDLAFKASDAVVLKGSYIPTLHVYGQSGFAGAANPFFESHVELKAEVNLTPELKFGLPVHLVQTRYQDFALNATNNDSWQHVIFIHPELLYAVNSNIEVGMAYRSDNLIESDFGGEAFDSGFEEGFFQLHFKASL